MSRSSSNTKPKPQPSEFLPNWKRRCIVCGQKPTITIKPIDGSPKMDTEMCGVCTWGEADCLDPDNW